MTYRHMAEIVRRRPVTLPGTATVQEACRTMHDQRIGAVMVVDGAGRLEGIFTGRDAVKLLAQGGHSGRTRLDAVMTRDPESMTPSHDAIAALRLMQDGGFRHMPVVADGQVVGIVSHGDFGRHEHARLDEETGIWERL